MSQLQIQADSSNQNRTHVISQGLSGPATESSSQTRPVGGFD